MTAQNMTELKTAMAWHDILDKVANQLLDLPNGYRIAVRGPVQEGFNLTWHFQTLEPGASPGGAGEWTIYGPINDEVRAHFYANRT